jgi:SAM-dependent methyltransferase
VSTQDKSKEFAMSNVLDAARERNRAVWEAGEWDKMAPYLAAAGPRLLDRIGAVGPGVRLLDIGTGSGSSVAVPAAQRGAEVVGADVTDASFPAACRRAEEARVDVEWVVADAVQLPFEDGSFDVVASTFGHMFAPDQQAAARELVRVCRPGGTIGLCCWTPEGHKGRLFTLIAALMPAPLEGFRPPVLWGCEPQVRELLEPLGVSLGLRHATVAVAFDSPEAAAAEYEAYFGPVVTAKAVIGDDRWPAARERLLAFLAEINERDDGTMGASYEYLEMIGRTPEA